MTRPYACVVAPEGIDVYNPAFDVTPADLIAGIVTENGVVAPVARETIARIVGDNQKAE